jgi:hypothetical protein
MTVREVIATASDMVGVGEQVKKYLNGDLTVGETETLALLRCFNFIQNEVALDYLPLVAEDCVTTETGRVEYSAFSRAAVRILSVKNEDDAGVKFKLFSGFLEGQPGTLKIKYTYTPNEKGLDDSVEVSMAVSLRLLAYGVAAEYCFSVGLYEEGEAWNKKYKDALAAAYSVRPVKVMRSRRWQ